MATLGPSSNELAIIKRLVEAGTDVFRLNMSHGTYDTHGQIYERVRRVDQASNRRPTAILADLSGPKIRVGRFVDGRIPLDKGSEVTVTTRDVLGDAGLIPSQYEALAKDVDPRGSHTSR